MNINNIEIEIFRDGKITKEEINFEQAEKDAKMIIKLIKTSSTIGNILEEMCKSINATGGYIVNGEKERKYYWGDVGDELKYIPSGHKIIISDDISKDKRFRKRKTKRTPILGARQKISEEAKSHPSLTADYKPPKITKLRLTKSHPQDLTLDVPYSVMIIPVADFHIILRKNVSLAREDILNISILISLIKLLLKERDNDATSGSDKNSSGDILPVMSKETAETKDIFLATISHELRTPLNGICGMISMLKDAGPLNEKQSEYLTILMECSYQLLGLLNNILDFSKMVSSRMVLLKGPMSISKSVSDAVLMVEAKAKAKGLRFNLNIQNSIPVLVGDGQRLTQILSNILSNAVKFTEYGHVSMKVKATKEQASSASETLPYVKKWRVTFEVEDTGVGIPIDEQPKIFNAFHQSYNIDSLMARNGTGLGLSISRELVGMMNGSIQFTSTGIPGRGTKFIIYIIAEEEIKMNDLGADHKEIFTGSKILVVDDRAEYRLQLNDLLFKWNCSPTVVSSGEEALQYISHGLSFDTIIVDICMPFMNGIELAQELKSNQKTAMIPLIALSSADLDDTNDMDLFDIYMCKPIDQNYLFPALLECLIKNKDIKEGRPPSPPRSALFSSVSGLNINGGRKASIARIKKRDLKILIAEDDHNNAFTIKEMLGYLGFNPSNIKTVDNGEKCVMEAKRTYYNVILMDILMPKMNGIEATKHIRQLNPRPYIIAVSAAVQNSDKERCQQVGISSYLTKPVLKEKLSAALAALVSD